MKSMRNRKRINENIWASDKDSGRFRNTCSPTIHSSFNEDSKKLIGLRKRSQIKG